MKNFINWIRKVVFNMLSDGEHISSMRVVLFMSTITVLGTFIYKNVTETGWVDFGSNAVMLILTLAGAKVAQSFSEAAENVKNKELESYSPRVDE